MDTDCFTGGNEDNEAAQSRGANDARLSTQTRTRRCLAPDSSSSLACSCLGYDLYSALTRLFHQPNAKAFGGLRPSNVTPAAWLLTEGQRGQPQPLREERFQASEISGRGRHLKCLATLQVFSGFMSVGEHSRMPGGLDAGESVRGLKHWRPFGYCIEQEGPEIAALAYKGRIGSPAAGHQQR